MMWGKKERILATSKVHRFSVQRAVGERLSKHFSFLVKLTKRGAKGLNSMALPK